MADPITRSIIIKGKVEDVFATWADVESFPQFMEHIKSVTRRDDRISHWVMQGPGGSTVQWDAETTMFEPPRRIGWNSRDSSPVKTSGQVLFTDLNEDETEVTVILKYEPPVRNRDRAGSDVVQGRAAPIGRGPSEVQEAHRGENRGAVDG